MNITVITERPVLTEKSQLREWNCLDRNHSHYIADKIILSESLVYQSAQTYEAFDAHDIDLFTEDDWDCHKGGYEFDSEDVEIETTSKTIKI